jgi:hypothetical protein
MIPEMSERTYVTYAWRMMVAMALKIPCGIIINF